MLTRLSTELASVVSKACSLYPATTARGSDHPTTYTYILATATTRAGVTALTGQTSQPQVPAQSSPSTNAAELSSEVKAGIAGGAIGGALIIAGLVGALVWQCKRTNRLTGQQIQHNEHVPQMAPYGGTQELGGSSLAGPVARPKMATSHLQRTIDSPRGGYYDWSSELAGNWSRGTKTPAITSYKLRNHMPGVELGGQGAFIPRPEMDASTATQQPGWLVGMDMGRPHAHVTPSPVAPGPRPAEAP
jgi:hypothetical protein